MIDIFKKKVKYIAAAILAILIALFFYFSESNQDNGEIPYLKADLRPNKVKPDPDSDITSNKYNPIYDQIKSQKYNTSVSIRPSPEKPVTIEAGDSDNITKIISEASDEKSHSDNKGVLGKGLVIVSEKNSDDDSESKIRKTKRYIYAQIASTRSKEDAEKEFQHIFKKNQKILKPFGHKIEKFDIENKGRYYKLLIGPISNASKAQLVCKKLIASGITCIIKRI